MVGDIIYSLYLQLKKEYHSSRHFKSETPYAMI